MPYILTTAIELNKSSENDYYALHDRLVTTLNKTIDIKGILKGGSTIQLPEYLAKQYICPYYLFTDVTVTQIQSVLKAGESIQFMQLDKDNISESTVKFKLTDFAVISNSGSLESKFEARDSKKIATESDLIKNACELLATGNQDITQDAPNKEEQTKLEINQMSSAKEQVAALKKLENALSMMRAQSGFGMFDSFSMAPKTFSDGAIEVMPGCIEKEIYNDKTGANILSKISFSWFNTSKSDININLVFKDTTRASHWRKVFNDSGIKMNETGTAACGFPSYSSLESAFVKLIEGSVVSKSYSEYFLSQIKTFMEGRYLLTSKSEMKLM